VTEQPPVLLRRHNLDAVVAAINASTPSSYAHVHRVACSFVLAKQ
jgi:hypothetical protein